MDDHLRRGARIVRHRVRLGPAHDRQVTRRQPDRLALGNDLLSRVAQMGARSQFTNTWDPTDPALHFGLYGPDR